MQGLFCGEAKVECYTSLQKALSGVRIAMAVIPACAHIHLVHALADNIEDSDILFLIPGRTFGSLEVANIFLGKGQKNLVAETNTFPFACRRNGKTGVWISGEKKKVELGVFPSKETDKAFSILKPILPNIYPVKDVRTTSLNNFGAVIHPTPLMLNLVLFESDVYYDFYTQTMTPSEVSILEKIDAERISVGQATGANVIDIRHWLCEAYGLTMNSLRNLFFLNKAYHGIKGPKELSSRCIAEDVPTGLVPMEELAGVFKLSTPAKSAMINLCNLLTDEDYRTSGRTLKKIGLHGLKLKDYELFFREGNTG